MNEKTEPEKAKQSMDRVSAGRDAKQHTDSANTSQAMTDVTANNDVTQDQSAPENISAFGMKGTGKWAVIAVVIIAIVYFAYKYLAK